jgi:hypothetical protein
LTPTNAEPSEDWHTAWKAMCGAASVRQTELLIRVLGEGERKDHAG